MGPVLPQHQEIAAVPVHVEDSHVQRSQSFSGFLAHKLFGSVCISGHGKVLNEAQDVLDKRLHRSVQDLTSHLNAGTRRYRHSCLGAAEAIHEVRSLLPHRALARVEALASKLLTFHRLEDSDFLAARFESVDCPSLAVVEADRTHTVLMQVVHETTPVLAQLRHVADGIHAPERRLARFSVLFPMDEAFTFEGDNLVAVICKTGSCTWPGVSFRPMDLRNGQCLVLDLHGRKDASKWPLHCAGCSAAKTSSPFFSGNLASQRCKVSL
mmetsp:Transcript_64092/g.115304  ORF Transcript_64092/g.115304 Transcript_64092/m.115304 type:complete len:268 (-) Transcript_64092:465-1268(-)